MNARFRLIIAILVSLLAHISLLIWILPQMQVRPPNGQGQLYVFLPQSADEHGRRQLQPPAGPSSSAIRKLETKHVNKLQRPAPMPATAKPPPSVTENRQAPGHFHWQPPPSSRQYEAMNAMQQAQLAHQRESRVTATLAGLSNLSVQLRPALINRINCTQQTDKEIDCIPAPKVEMRLLLVQFFNLALEAHRLGIAENPVRMDFGPKSGVSVTLLP